MPRYSSLARSWVEGNTKNWAHLRIEANVIGIAIFAVIELLVLPQAAAAGARARVVRFFLLRTTSFIPRATSCL